MIEIPPIEKLLMMDDMMNRDKSLSRNFIEV